MFSFVVAYILDSNINLDNYKKHMKKLLITVIVIFFTPQIKTDSITYVYQVSNIQIKIRNNVASKIEVDLRTGEIFKELYY